MATQKRALVLSPFATTPLDAGQRKRAHQTTQLFKSLGYEITFVLYAFEAGWQSRANEEWIARMRDDWDEVIVWRANVKVGTRPSSGILHDPDEWWDVEFEPFLRQLLSYRFFDVFVVHNVWLSKAFDLAPRSTLRILDSHDVFSSRMPYFERARIPPEFFITDPVREAAAADRADIVLAIQKHDEDWFAKNARAIPICIPYASGDSDVAAEPRYDYLHKDKVVVGFLGSAHIFNINGLLEYCAALKDTVGEMAAPVEFRIGGKVSKSIDMEGPWLTCELVDDDKQFFSAVDIAVVPVFDGSGFKVKVADIVAMGLPLLCSEHAAIGLKLDPKFIASDARDLARKTVEIALQRPRYEDLCRASLNAYQDLSVRAELGLVRLKHGIEHYRRTIAYDLTGLSVDQASLVLLGWSGAFHLGRPNTKQLVIAPDILKTNIEGLVPSGTFVISPDEIGEYANEIWRWITVASVGAPESAVSQNAVFVDEFWRDALDDEGERSLSSDVDAFDQPAIWHNVSWDPVIKNLVTDAQRRQKSSLTHARTAYVSEAGRAERLSSPLSKFMVDAAVVDIGKFEEFFDVAMRLAAGTINRLIVFGAKHPQRVSVLAQLCAARGIGYLGPLTASCFTNGDIDEGIARRNYQQFEQRWRIPRPSHARL